MGAKGGTKETGSLTPCSRTDMATDASERAPSCRRLHEHTYSCLWEHIRFSLISLIGLINLHVAGDGLRPRRDEARVLGHRLRGRRGA